MAGPSSRLGRLEEQVGELLATHGGDTDLEQYAEWRDDPVGFSREPLGDDPGPWGDEREVMEAVRDHDRVAWRSGQGVGKGWTIARLALWWAYARQGLVLISAPTSRTVHEATMRKELARAFRRAGLPGDLFVNALRIRGEEPSILAFTTTQASGGTGHHDRAVLAVLDEAQGCDGEAWEAMYANIVGSEDTFLATGNPLEPVGEFFEVSRPESGWYTVQTSCLEHPNLRENHPRHIPGGPSEEWLERMEDRWGRGTPMWTARVEGEFPTDSVEGLYRRQWIDDAIRRGGCGGDGDPVVSVDVARHGLNETVAAVAREGTVERLEVWSGASTSETVVKVKAVANEAGVLKRYDDLPFAFREAMRKKGEAVPPYGRIVVDEVGVGGGVVDQLEDDGWPVRGFNDGGKAKQKNRYANAKAEAHWTLRERLEDGAVSLPDDRKLREELLAVKWSPDSKGRVQIESKDDLKSRIGRSPDRMDAVTMVFSRAGRTGGGLSAEAMQTRY